MLTGIRGTAADDVIQITLCFFKIRSFFQSRFSRVQIDFRKADDANVISFGIISGLAGELGKIDFLVHGGSRKSGVVFDDRFLRQAVAYILGVFIQQVQEIFRQDQIIPVDRCFVGINHRSALTARTS